MISRGTWCRTALSVEPSLNTMVTGYWRTYWLGGRITRQMDSRFEWSGALVTWVMDAMDNSCLAPTWRVAIFQGSSIFKNLHVYWIVLNMEKPRTYHKDSTKIQAKLQNFVTKIIKTKTHWPESLFQQFWAVLFQLKTNLNLFRFCFRKNLFLEIFRISRFHRTRLGQNDNFILFFCENETKFSTEFWCFSLQNCRKQLKQIDWSNCNSSSYPIVTSFFRLKLSLFCFGISRVEVFWLGSR